MASEDVVCEGEPTQHAENLFTAADEELAQAPVAEAGINAFARSASLVDAFAVRAFHPSSPGCHSGAIIRARSVGVGIMLALDGLAIHLHAACGGPFDIFIFVEAAIDEMPLRQLAKIPLDSLHHGPHQSAVGAGCLRTRGNDDLAPGHGGDLAV